MTIAVNVPVVGNGACAVAGAGQEQYYNCADIAITTTGEPVPTEHPQTPKPTDQPPTGENCRAIGPWEGNAGMDAWCRDNCPLNCPGNTCECE